MQIHELNTYTGTPGNDDYLPIDDGSETRKIAASILTENRIWYGTCGTTSGRIEKTVACSDFSLKTGVTIAVKFTYSNIVAEPTMNVNGTGAVPIKTKTTSSTLKGAWSEGSVMLFTYDGTSWIQTGADNDIDQSVITLFTSLGWTQ